MSSKAGKFWYSGDSSRRHRTVALLVFAFVFLGYALSSCSNGGEEKKETQNPTIQTGPEIAEQMAQKMINADFSTFKHDSPEHNRLACLFCHQTSADMPKPKLAGHTSCAGCHVKQFEDKTNKICTICHTEPVTAEVKAFPALKSFNIQFNHASHFKESNCATCHKTQSGGGMDIPSGADAHATCFQCHTPEKIVGDKNLGSCATCHQPGTPERAVDTTKTIGFNFNHANHSGLNCNTCHNDLGGNNMSAPTVAMHSQVAGQSCASCHNGGQAFGAKTFSDCRSCHTQFAGTRSFGVRFDHSNHAKVNCATCHKSGGKTAAFTVPSGEGAHTTCFECHSPTKRGTTMNNSYCFSCHQAGNPEKFGAQAQSIAANVSHSKHRNMNCNSCHQTRGGDMSAPAFAMHKASKNVTSCATCHNNKRAFGEDFSNCKRCHTREDFKIRGGL